MGLVFANAKLDRVHVAGALLLLAGIIFFLGMNIAMSTYPNFSVSGNWVADLGATGEQPASTFYAATKLSVGVLAIASSYLLWPVAKPRRPILFLGIAGIAIFGSIQNIYMVQDLSSLVAFLFGALAAIDSYRIVRRPLGYFFVALGAIALIAIFIIVSVNAGIAAPSLWMSLGKGGWEWMVLYSDFLWVIVFGTTLMTSRELFAKNQPEPDRPRA